MENTFYYTRPNGDCFMGEYSDQGENWEQPVVLTKVNTTSQPDPTPTPVAPTPTPEKPNQLAFVGQVWMYKEKLYPWSSSS